MKKILIIIDGAADLPSKQLNNKTALEAANIPYLDYLAKYGKCGLISVINNKIAPETEGAVLSFFGYNPLKYNKGRAPLEVIGIGQHFKKNSLAVRCNFSTINKNKIIDTEAGKIKSKYAKILVKYLQNKIKLPIKFKLIHTLNYRFLLILECSGLSEDITNNHPGYKKVSGNLEIPQRLGNSMQIKLIKPLNKKAIFTANLLNNFVDQAKSLLKNHPINKKLKIKANFVIMRGYGTKLPKLKKLNMKAACLGDTAAERGISKLLGLNLIKLPDPECDLFFSNKTEMEKAVKKDMQIRLNTLLRILKKYDFVYIHLKGPDTYGHRNKPLLKKYMLELIDKYFIKQIVKKIVTQNIKIIITSDHCTACSKKTHTPDPVPLLIFGSGSDDIKRFNEKSCKNGSIGLIYGTSLIKLIQNL